MYSFYMCNLLIDFLKEKNVELYEFSEYSLQSDARVVLYTGTAKYMYDYNYIYLYYRIKDKIDINECIRVCMANEIDFIIKKEQLNNCISAKTFYDEIVKLTYRQSSSYLGLYDVIYEMEEINELIKAGFLLNPIYIGSKRFENAVYSKSYAIYFLLTLQKILQEYDEVIGTFLKKYNSNGGNRKQYSVLRLRNYSSVRYYYPFDFNVELISCILSTKDTKFKQIWRYLTKKNNETQSVLNTIYGKPEIAKQLGITIAKLEKLIRNDIIVIVNKVNNKIIRNNIEQEVYDGKTMKIDYTPNSIESGNGFFSLRRFYVKSYRNKLKITKG